LAAAVEIIIPRDIKHLRWVDGTVVEQEIVLEELVAVVVAQQTFAEELR
jgi:uncharacterized coiled-coil protein SlyX